MSGVPSPTDIGRCSTHGLADHLSMGMRCVSLGRPEQQQHLVVLKEKFGAIHNGLFLDDQIMGFVHGMCAVNRGRSIGGADEKCGRCFGVRHFNYWDRRKFVVTG